MTGTDVKLLQTLNPELKLNRVPYSKRPYVLRAPSEVTEYFAKYSYSLQKEYGRNRYASSKSNSGPMPGSNYKPGNSRPYQHINANTGSGKLRYHTVKEGEVVGAIAEAYGVSARSIANWNRLYRYRIRVGQKLKIYSDKTPAPVAKVNNSVPVQQATASMGPSPSGAVYHRIRRGETIWEIAKKYDGQPRKVF